ncbi:hypothetical protein [Massilia luteola]|uniref:hypothetical protein n=1 Tax=Massilia luteola TaxID=3081751 RepID=UPI002ACBDC53|nr:hypothetical protein [Massilia sp. Gc5]
MQDEAIYRCVNAACARGMPRRVNYCPYCGTAQQAGAPAASPDDGRGRREAAAVAAVAGAEAAAELSGWSDAPDAGFAAETVRGAAAAPARSTTAPEPSATASAKPTAAAAPPPSATASARPTAAAAPPPSATAFGHGGRPVDAGTAAPERARGIPWPPTPTPTPAAAHKPPGRQPIRLRWWIVALAVLWGVWLWAKPSAKKIDRRIDAAIAQAQDCHGKEAQEELIALRAGRATPQQLERLQRALNEASSACTRKRQRANAWGEARGAVESALAAGNAERARARLQAFTKRWGEDDDTRTLKVRVDAARGEHPLAVPAANGGDTPSARNLIREAKADLARGDYGAARDKMDLCLTMVDPSDRDCAALKRQAGGQ